MTLAEKTQVASHAAVILLCGVAAVSIAVLTITAHSLIKNLTSDIARTGTAVDKLNKTLDKINQPCEPIKGQKLTADDYKPCGTLADVNQTLRSMRGTMGVIEAAGRHENRNLTTLDRQEETLFADVHKTLTAGTGTLKAATVDLETMKPTIAAATDALSGIGALADEGQGTFRRFNSAMDSSLALSTLTHVTHITAMSDQMTTDSATWFHQKLYPTKKKGFVSGFEATGDVMKHWLPSLF